MIPNDPTPFVGGLLIRILRRLGATDETLERLRKVSVVLLPLITWLPLFILSVIGGRLMPGSVKTPFLLDLAVHVRLLVALPLFLLGALIAEQRLIPTLHQFLTRRLVPDKAMDRFYAAVNSAFRLGDSEVADVVIIAAVYSLDTFFVWRHLVAPQTLAWYGGGPGSPLTAAGVFYAYVTLPIFQFILLRWYFRLFIWARFLSQVARLGLRLVPTNPDRLGGLGFLIPGTQAFIVFAMAHGALLAGWMASRVFLRGVPLTQFKDETVALLVWVICITVLPLLFFTLPLVDAKRRGIYQYGALAARYAREFDDKWVQQKSDSGEPLIGSADIQSLADMGGSYDLVQGMRSVPITPQMLISFGIATLIPVAPLLLTVMPIDAVIKKLAGVLF